MHTAHCARNIVLCLKCNEPIPKKQFQEHDCQEPPALETVASSHPVIPSSRPTALKAVAASHPTVIPSSRPAPSAVIPSVPNECQYCHLEFPGQNLEQHEDYCGSRTEQCPECSDYVMLKEWEKHQSMRLYHGRPRPLSKSTTRLKLFCFTRIGQKAFKLGLQKRRRSEQH